MSSLTRRIAPFAAGFTLALAVSAAPASAAGRAVPQSCVIPSGVYGIVDSTGALVAILIVYPDCRTEIFKKQEPS
ncbi:hypothetical protein [Longimicrobium sp.]|uniref:hypothetical protein n=1 Tax=Longimicrobium sp. TaxID=2029185 RepID=UPI002E30FF1E|nr:hypothetical protein [Longimicrobium sp.]HEX6040132.1 hypothetical protein [Longimicrobium sp.]